MDSLNIDWRYAIQFYAQAIRGIIRKQNIVLHETLPTVKQSFLLTNDLKQRWFQFYEVQDPKAKVHFPFYFKLVENFFLHSMYSLGFNYRNILHLGHELIIPQPLVALEGDHKYVFTAILKDLAVLGENKLALINEITITDEQGTVITAALDFVFLKNVDPTTVSVIKNTSKLNNTDVSRFKGLSQKRPQLSNYKELPISIQGDLGLKYGRLSGDMNPLHTNLWLAKVFGYPAAFVQGMWTFNQLLKFFQADLNEQVSRCNVFFCNPLFLGQTIFLRFNKRAFELLDPKGRLILYGTRS